MKTCFIITPLGEDSSPVRRKADGLIASVIKPVLAELGYKCLPPHEIDASGSITVQIVRQILEAPMVVANLTDLNPNVMYELAIRHAKRLPVISVVERGTRLPFDLAAERTIFFDNDMMGVEILKPQLKNAILTAEGEDLHDNPIYRAIKESTIIKEITASSGSDSVQSFIIDKLEELSNKISRIPSALTNSSEKSMQVDLTKTYGSFDLVHSDEKHNSRASIIALLGTMISTSSFRISDMQHRAGFTVTFLRPLPSGWIEHAKSAFEKQGWDTNPLPF